MVNIGEYNTLTVLRQEASGSVLDGGELGEIVLPQSQYVASKNTAPKANAQLNVFIYRDSKNRLTATEIKPRAQVGEIAYLKALDVNKAGAFLDWGLEKDLLMPFDEQISPIEVGHSYLVMVFLDDDYRIAASAKIDEFLEDSSEGEYNKGQAVKLMVANPTDMGVKVIVNDSHWGLVYKNEIFQPLKRGQKLTGFIKRVRDDGKLDLSLQKPGYSHERMDRLCNQIMAELEKQGGFLAVNDKAEPEKIKAIFAISKKQFKQAIGKLYKLRKITIDPDGIRLVANAK